MHERRNDTSMLRCSPADSRERDVTLFCIADALGWAVIGDRLRQQIIGDNSRQSKIVMDRTPSLFKRVSWRVDYGTQKPLHLPLFDPCVLNSWKLSGLARDTDSYSRVIAATQEQAFPFVKLQTKRPVYILCDVTRHLHSSDFGSQNVSAKHLDLERQIYERSEHIFVLSSWVRNDLSDFYGISKDKITVCLPPHNRPKQQRLAQPTEEQPGRKLKVLFVGGDFKRKGGDLLVSWQREYLSGYIDMTIVTDSNCHDHSVPATTWIGNVDNARVTEEIMPCHDLLCHPTQKDCSAIVVSEAAAVGVPTIASRVGGISDLVVEGVTGFMRNKDDHSGFVTTIIDLCKNRDRLEKMSAASRENAIKNLDPGHFYDNIVGHLR
jgi:glycosyltransferase involved in cell wall biosynthesis